MKYTLLVVFVFCTSFSSPENNIFICGPRGAKKYHYNENCRGLSSCSHGITKTTLKEAQSYGLTLCGWED
ncbi:hypothetical protein ACE01P_20050 [Flavobacterium sp. HJSW_4]